MLLFPGHTALVQQSLCQLPNKYLVSERKRRFFEKTFKNQIELEIIMATKLGKIISNRQLADKF